MTAPDHIAEPSDSSCTAGAVHTWCFGLPAMLKGYFDRLMMPGVSIDLSDPGNVKVLLGNIRKIAGISTYGRARWLAIYMRDPSRVMIKRYLKRLTGGAATVEYHALYHMNVATEGQRRGFIAKVAKAMERF